MPNYASLKKNINLHNLSVVTVIIFVSLAINNLVRTNILATQGSLVSEMEMNTLKLEKENEILSVKIAEISKMADLESQAIAVNFKRADNIVFAPKTNTFALR